MEGVRFAPKQLCGIINIYYGIMLNKLLLVKYFLFAFSIKKRIYEDWIFRCGYLGNSVS